VIAGFLQCHSRIAAGRLALASLPLHHYEGFASGAHPYSKSQEHGVPIGHLRVLELEVLDK